MIKDQNLVADSFIVTVICCNTVMLLFNFMEGFFGALVISHHFETLESVNLGLSPDPIASYLHVLHKYSPSNTDFLI